MSHAATLPATVPAAPTANANVMGTVFVQRLSAANALARKLRGWGIAVVSIVIPAGSDHVPPVLWVKPAPDISIKPFLAATAQRRRWIPAVGRMPDRMVAFLDGCEIMWELGGATCTNQ